MGAPPPNPRRSPPRRLGGNSLGAAVRKVECGRQVGERKKAGWCDPGKRTPARGDMNITVTSLLKRVLPLKGFCYAGARWDEYTGEVIEVELAARRGARARCSCCRHPA